MVKLVQVATNATMVEIGEFPKQLKLYFSYETVVGFNTSKTGIVLSENVWGNTTGKHLNYFGSKDSRVPREKFLEQLKNMEKEYGLA